MKKLLCAFLFILFVQSVSCQNAYYDALKLRKYIENGRFIIPLDTNDTMNKARMEDYFIIVNSYYNNKFKKPKDLHDVVAEFDSLNRDYNPFLADFLSPGSVQSFTQDSDAGKFTSSSKLSSLGSLNVTNLADGIARFLIKRGKEELNVAFFNRMKKFLDDPKHPECKTLFPVTTEFLKSIATYRYAELIQSLREAFYKDLSNLIVNINQLIDLPKYKELLKHLPEIRLAVRCSKIVSELSQADEGILPDSLIHQLAGLPEWDQINSNLGNSLKLVNIVSQSIREIPVSADSGKVARRWIKLSDFNNLIKDPVTLKIFIGLVYQNVSSAGIQFNIHGTVKRADAFMKDNAATINVISGLVENFAILATDVDRTIKDFHDKQKNGKLSNDDYYSYISKAINITEYGFKVANIINEGVINDDYIIMARNANELYKNIYTKNYNNAVMNTYTILDHAFNKLSQNQSISQADRDSLKSIGPKTKVIENILKYGNFMASVVKAESGEDVQNALETAALPVGSYSIKQKSALNISVNGYIGYAFDFNKIFFKDIYARGVYAPVGISVSRGSVRKHGLTVTGFVSLIDVGAVATYRLSEGNSASLKQEVRLESIFSPSCQLFLGISRVTPCNWGRI